MGFVLFAIPATSQTPAACNLPSICATKADLDEVVRLECAAADRKGQEFDACDQNLTDTQREKWQAEGRLRLLVAQAIKADTLIWGARAENLRLEALNERLSVRAARWWIWGIGGLLTGMLVTLGALAYARQ